MGDSCDLRYKYVEITAHLLLGDAGKLSVNFLSALNFSNIQEIVESAKLKRSKEALTAMNTVTASVSGENLEKYRCKMQLCKQLGIPAR
jgi:hypothetical protein